MISLIITVAVLGLIVWLVTTYIPMPEPFRSIIWVIAIIALVILLLNFAGINLGVPVR